MRRQRLHNSLVVFVSFRLKWFASTYHEEPNFFREKTPDNDKQAIIDTNTRLSLYLLHLHFFVLEEFKSLFPQDTLQDPISRKKKEVKSNGVGTAEKT